MPDKTFDHCEKCGVSIKQGSTVTLDQGAWICMQCVMKPIKRSKVKAKPKKKAKKPIRLNVGLHEVVALIKGDCLLFEGKKGKPPVEFFMDVFDVPTSLEEAIEFLGEEWEALAQLDGV